MKRLLSTEFTVGTFALLGLSVIIYMSLQVNDRGSLSGSSKEYHAYFQSVSGLVTRVPVEVSGISSGYVLGIHLEGNRAKVTIAVGKDVKVFADASLTVRDRGILGDRFLMLNPGSSEYPELKDGGEIMKTYSRSDLENLASSLGETANMIQELIKSDQPQGALGQVIVNLRDMTDQMNDIVGDNRNRIGRILTNMEGFSEDLNEITGDNKDQIRAVLVALEDVAQSMKNALGTEGAIGHATQNFDETMASLRRIVEKVEQGEGTVGKLLNDETTVNHLNDTLESVNDTLGLFKRLSLGVRYRGEYLVSDKELQNLIGIKVSPAPDKYLLFEIVDAPRGETKVIDTVVLSNGNAISTTQTIQTGDDVLFTFLLAKRFWNATVRFGLIRNDGGVGLDYHLFKDKFVVSVEAFDFGRVNNDAHLRAYGTLVLYKHLLLTGGVDDLLTDVGGRNAFFGAGIQFTDDDLKALVTALPAARF